jgi:PAS domain S-box-containing protein
MVSFAVFGLILARVLTVRAQTESALRESEAFYRSTVEDQTELVCRFKGDGTLTFVNDAYCKYFGKTHDQLVGTRFLPMIPEEDRPAVSQHFDALSRERPVATQEHRVITPDGSVRWQQWTDRAIFDDDGRIVEFQGAGHDTTDRKQAEEALRESEGRLRSFYEASLEGLVISEGGRFVDANVSFTRMLGFDLHELQGKDVIELVAPEDREVVMERIRSGYDKPYEHRALHRDGSILYVEVCGKPIRYQGKLCRIMAIHDISVRKRAEQALRESLQTSADIVRSIPSGLFIYHYEPPDRLILLDANPEAERLTGLSIEECRGREFNDLWATARQRGILEDFLNVMWTGKNYETEDLYYQDERLEGYYRIRAFPMPGTRLGVAFEDVLELKRAEEKLNRMEAQLNHVARLSTMGEMVACIAHEVNQPLYSILNFAKASRNTLAAEGGTNLDGVRDWIEEIAAAAEHAGEIIKRLRSFVRRAESKRSVTNIDDIVKESVQLVAFDTRRRQVAVQLELSEGSPAVNVDRVEIQQVLANLIRNACEAMERVELEGRRVTIRTTATDGFVEVSVADSGPGLPADESMVLFEAFVTTKPGGLGMGLTISATIVKAHNGKMWATANQEGGATLHFTLPIADPASTY